MELQTQDRIFRMGRRKTVKSTENTAFEHNSVNIFGICWLFAVHDRSGNQKQR